MDYNSESELIESLDYLTLPVKRSSSIGTGSDFCDKNKTQFQRVLRNKVSHKTQTTHSLHKCNDTLISNSRKKEVFEHYAIKTISDKCLGDSNPIKPSLIKVTVTPKKPKFNVARRKQNPKNLHNTVSVEDRSIQTKHMCSFVTTRKRERQYTYNIKTTESAKQLKDLLKRNDGISLDQVKSARQVINSLNMDKKRKKSPGYKRASSPTKTSKANKAEKNIQANGCQSVVRIIGQIGLRDDNHIVVHCGVEGTQVPKNKDEKGYQYEKFLETNAGKLQHTVSQGTQMDIDFVDTAPNRKTSMYSNNVACYCNNITKVDEFGTSTNNYSQSKGCHSPLVVITVYPNDDRCEHVKIFKYHNQCQSNIDDLYGSLTNINNLPKSSPNHQYQEHEYNDELKIEQNSEAPQRRSRPPSRKGNGRKVETKTKRDTSQPRSVSPSTISSSSQNVKPTKLKKNNNARPNETKSPRSPRNLSPSKNSEKFKPKEADNQKPRYHTLSPEANKQHIKRLEVGNKNISKRPKDVEKNLRSPSSSRSPSSLRSNHNVKRPDTENKKTKTKEHKYQKESKGVGSTTIATNTDHVLTKKALVETFTKEIMGQMDRQKNVCKPPQFATSQLMVNVDNADENLDVLLQQGRMTADIRVKKATKYSCGTSYKNRNSEFLGLVYTPETSKSLLNMIDIDDIKNADYISPHKKNDNFDVPEIKVKDSLEIGHKRKEHAPQKHAGHNFENRNQNATTSDATESFAQVKHYRGDRCLVSNPIKRDKEIRQLLGLEAPPRNECVHSRNECGPACPCRVTLDSKIPDVVERPHRNTCQLFHANEKCKLRTKRITTGGEPRTNLIKHCLTTVKQTTGTQYEAPSVETDMPKKLVLNKNIQVFLQIEKFSKDKPIVLSRKQYQKVKRAIESTIYRQQKCKMARPKFSVMTTEFEKKKKIKRIEEYKSVKNSNVYSTKPKETYESRETSILFSRAFRPEKANEKAEYLFSRAFRQEKDKNLCSRAFRQEKTDDRDAHLFSRAFKQEKADDNDAHLFSRAFRQEKADGRDAHLFSKAFRHEKAEVLFTRAFKHEKAAENLELKQHYVSAGDILTKRLETYDASSTKVVVGSSYSHSIHTIFNGLKRCRTPNLGNSTCSFISNSTNENHECRSKKNLKAALDKPRKPFLRRLMSCLILRASTESKGKISAIPQQRSSYNSSIDSYHISTSLGAIEMSSSIYDTSESFYSNHSVQPISSKYRRERGFFGSVRGLLTGKN